MMPWTLRRVADALRDELLGARPDGEAPLGRISTDTRTLATGDVFVALVGEQFDGHSFCTQAVESGAAALVVSDARAVAQAGVPVFLVEDTTRALGALGRYWRRAWGGRVVAIAGSNGKTSTKDLVASVLSQGFRVHATRGNLNNHIGVPLTLLDLPGDADIAVVEIGTNHPGEVATLRAIAEPDLAVITSIGEEHLEGFGSLEGVLQEEASVAVDVPLAVTPALQPEVGHAVRALGASVIEAGLEAGDVRADAWGLDPDAHPWLQLHGVDARVRLPLAGAHNARNAMLAVAVGEVCGLSPEQVVAGLASSAAPVMRSRVEALGSLRVLNDAYNANPASAREALATFDALGGAGQRVVVLGSMLELGPQGPALHDEIATRALASRADVIGAVGAFAEAFARVAPGDARVVSAPDVVALWPLLRPRLQPACLVLLKGSRGTRLERLLPELRTFAGVAAADSPVH